MSDIRSLYNQVTQLHRTIDKNRREAEQATQDSLNCGLEEDYERAKNEASHATRLMHEICALGLKVIAIEQQIADSEHQMLRLHQQEVSIREDNLNHIAHIDHETKQKLDSINQQVKSLRG